MLTAWSKGVIHVVNCIGVFGLPDIEALQLGRIYQQQLHLVGFVQPINLYCGCSNCVNLAAPMVV